MIVKNKFWFFSFIRDNENKKISRTGQTRWVAAALKSDLSCLLKTRTTMAEERERERDRDKEGSNDKGRGWENKHRE